MKIDFSRPGFALSVLGHGTIVAALILPLWWLSTPPADDNMPEAVPIETISQTDFNQIMKGEKSSKDVTKEPTTKADKVAQVDEQHALPANPDVQKETPPPPPPKPAAPTPPVPTPPLPPPPPPVPEPPQRPDPTPTPPLPPDVPTPPKPVAKPAPAKPAPPAPTPPERDPDAEVIKQAAPQKPVPMPPKPPEPQKRAEVKPPPVPPKPLPTPPKVPERPAPKKPDQMAKLLDQSQEDADPTPEAKPTPRPTHKAAPHAKPSPTQTAAADGTAAPSDQKAFDPTDISKMLASQPAGAPPSTGRTLSKTASRGATSGNAPKMSPSQSDALDGLLADQFKQCWSYLGLDHGRYIPEIKVSYAEDGSLQSEPQLLNRPSDPNARGLAESALRAVKQCNPLHIPAQFAPFYDQWRSRILRFDPAEMAG